MLLSQLLKLRYNACFKNRKILIFSRNFLFLVLFFVSFFYTFYFNESYNSLELKCAYNIIYTKTNSYFLYCDYAWTELYSEKNEENKNLRGIKEQNKETGEKIKITRGEEERELIN